MSYVQEYIKGYHISCHMTSPYDHQLSCPWWIGYGSWKKPWNIEFGAQDSIAHKKNKKKAN